MKKPAPVDRKAIKTVKSIVSTAVTAVAVIIGALAIWILIDKFIIGSPVPRLFGYSALCVESGSMSGEIEVNDLVIIKRTDDYAVNDIVTYLKEGDTVPTTHRVVSITSDGRYVTKGDANNTNDRFPVNKNEILGEVVSIKAGAGATLMWMQSQGWIYLLGFSILLSVALLFLDTDNEENVGENEKSDENEKETGKEINDA